MDKIERLKRIVDQNRAGREQDAARGRWLADRWKMIREAYQTTRLGFWCDKCRKDFEGVAHKRVIEWGNMPPWAFYIGFCPQGHEARRRITDKQNDPYYRNSEMIRRQRIDMADAMLTPDNPRFRVVYPAQWRKLEEERAKREEMEASMKL